jgi:hypothetical protein
MLATWGRVESVVNQPESSSNRCNEYDGTN